MEASTPVNLSQFRRRHSELMREALKLDGSAALADKVEPFMTELAAFGTELSSEDDRVSAQNILDYWAASFAGEIRRSRRSVKLRSFEGKPQSADAAAPPAASKENPFRDIGHISSTDGERLPGREDAIQAVLKLLDQYGVVFVIGPAGSGRSALVNAGVLLQLENASETRKILSLSTPGKDPLASLAALAPQTGATRINQAPAAFRADFEAACGNGPGVLSIDNAEELFTRCGDQSAREAFAVAVSSLYASRDGHHNGVIIVLREEWDEQIFALKGFASVPREARFRPPPPTAAELQRMIRIPAAAAGVTFESGIVEDLARELQGDMAALPLVQFMLIRLWSLSIGGRIDWDVYHRAGRPQDALGRVAKDTYNSLSNSGKEAAERLVLTLAVPGRGESYQGSVARSRRESRRVLTDDEHDTAMVEAVDAFKGAGLLRASTYGEATDDSLEIIHDGLLQRWSEAVEWLVDEKRRSQDRLDVLNYAGLWQKSGQPEGLLLANRALVDKYTSPNFIASTQSFSSFSDMERGLFSEYIEASEDYLNRQDRRNRRISIGQKTLLAFGVFFGIFVGLFYSDFYAPDRFTAHNPINRLALRNNAIVGIKDPVTNRDDRKDLFRRLSRLQNITSIEINLSPARVDRLDLTNIRLYAPNFDGSSFTGTRLDGAILPNATLHGGSFEGTNFPKAKLRFAQFQDATFQGPTSFLGADLYGVAFDRAELCEVDFSEAGLGNATFWGASFPQRKDKFLDNFRDSPWWLASGWTKEHLQWLQESPFKPEVIAKSGPFIGQVKQYEDLLGTLSGAFALAVGNNNLAWELATWGVCVQQRCQEIPDAEEKADAAVKLISERWDKAEASDSNKKILSQRLASILDTRGYIRLQKGKLQDADKDLEQAVKLGESAPSEEALFHYSVALKALDKAQEATGYLKRSFDGGYRPSHELRNLWRYIDTGKEDDAGREYKKQMWEGIEKMSVQAKPLKTCPSPP